MQQGHDVGMLARRLFPGGVEVCERSLDQAIRTTRELVANPEVPAIFEAVLEHQNVLVKVDILHRRRDGRWRLIEVKSTTDVKDHHIEDVGIQYRVVSRCGVDVASACLGHVNRNYVYPGGEIDPRRFFRIRNLTRRVQRLQPKLTFQLRSEFTVLSMPKAPDIAPGRHCTDPVTCEFFDQCNPPRPDDHIGYLPRIHASAMEELEEMGIESIRDIPDDFELTEIQRRAADCVQTGEPWFSPELRQELDGLTYPLYFVDFETVNPAIPRFAGMRPYDQLPFQWSVHVQQQPGAEPEHHEFLATDANDPRREFISLTLRMRWARAGASSCIPRSSRRGSPTLPVGFLSSRIGSARSKPACSICCPSCGNTSTIRHSQARTPSSRCLPALVPEMTYEGMQVANGQDAGLAWESLVRGSLDQVERDRIRKALLDYCGQDTLAMVRLLEKLWSILV